MIRTLCKTCQKQIRTRTGASYCRPCFRAEVGPPRRIMGRLRAKRVNTKRRSSSQVAVQPKKERR